MCFNNHIERRSSQKHNFYCRLLWQQVSMIRCANECSCPTVSFVRIELVPVSNVSLVELHGLCIREKPKPRAAKPRLDERCDGPKDICDVLDDYVIGQGQLPRGFIRCRRTYHYKRFRNSRPSNWFGTLRTGDKSKIRG